MHDALEKRLDNLKGRNAGKRTRREKCQLLGILKSERIARQRRRDRA